MDIHQWVLMTLSAAFGAGGGWATVQARVKQNEKDLQRVETTLNNKLDKLDTKIDRIMDHLLDMPKGNH